MNNHQWFRCSNKPNEVLRYVERRVSRMQIRRVAVECCRRVQHLLVDDVSRNALRVAERFCERRASNLDREAAWALANDAQRGQRWPNVAQQHAAHAAFLLVARGMKTSSYRVMERVRLAKHFEDRSNDAHDNEQIIQSQIIRDVCGGYRCKTEIPKHCLTEPVRSLAGLMDESQCYDEMPILGDALEEAGVDDWRILNHCRKEGLHVGGCWVLDRIRRATAKPYPAVEPLFSLSPTPTL